MGRIASAFGSFNKPGAGLLKTAILGLILIGIQSILDNAFECPTSKYSPILAGCYSMAFFLCPAIIFLFLGLMYFPGASKKHWCPCWSSKHTFFYVTLQIIKAPIIWLLIAVTDGRFLACFVVAVSRYTLDREFYLYVFQTTGVLAITLLVILSYVYSKLPCDCFSENKRTYRVLHHVETILDKEKHEKQQAEDKQKFLEGLHKTGEFKYRRLPKYMLDARHLLNSKLKKCSTAEPHEGGHGEHEEGKDEKHEEGEVEKHEGDDEQPKEGEDEKHKEGEDEKHKEGEDEKHKEGEDEKHKEGEDEKHKEGEDEKHKEGEDGKHKEGDDEKHKEGEDEKHKEGEDEKHKEGEDEKHNKGNDEKHNEGEHEKHKEGEDGKHKEGENKKHKVEKDKKHKEGKDEKHKEGEDGKHKEGENKKHKEGKDEKHKEGKDEKHLKEEDWKYKEGEDGKTVQYPPPDYLP